MCSKKFFVRFLPFFATFLIGIFVASFFVAAGRPEYSGRRFRHMQGDRRMRAELDRLREENSRLEAQINELRSNALSDRSDSDVIQAVPPPPIPPMPPRPFMPRTAR